MKKFWNRTRSRDTAHDYVPGDCDVCRQSGVKVKALSCGRHKYCRMCAEFEPRIVSGNLTCMVCSDEQRKQDAEKRGRVDEFLSVHTGFRSGHSGHIINIGDSNILTEDDDASEDADLDGNNNEWDHLLQSIVTPTPESESPPPSCQFLPDNPRSLVYFIPKKKTYLPLALPSATVDCESSSSSPSRLPLSHTVTELLDRASHSLQRPSGTKTPTNTPRALSEQPSPPHLTTVAIDRDLNKQTATDFQPYVQMEACFSKPDTVEEERCSSPCKAERERRKENRECDVPEMITRSASQTEMEAMWGEIGDIEGPGFCSSSSSRSGSSHSLLHAHSNIVYDNIWDA